MGVFIFSVKAQDYKTSIGVRGGFSNGLTVKHFTGSSAAIEVILSSRWRGFKATALFEKHGRAISSSKLNYYYGLGGHIGVWESKYTPWGRRGTSYTVIGVDGILGLEYTFDEIPFNISLDWKPELNLFGYNSFWADEAALSVRFIF